jgi:hypothetical protein
MFAEGKGIKSRGEQLHFAALRRVKYKTITPPLPLEPHQQIQKRGQHALIHLAIFKHHLEAPVCGILSFMNVHSKQEHADGIQNKSMQMARVATCCECKSKALQYASDRATEGKGTD